MVRWLLLSLALLATSATAAGAQDRGEVERQFQSWLASEVWPQAKAAGVSKATFEKAFDGVRLDWNLPELQPPGVPVEEPTIEWQAEFRSPANYFGEAGLKGLARQGRGRLAEWSKTLSAIVERYGVPADILVAIWGKETVYGTFALPVEAVRTLATEAFMGRRAALFRAELIAALTILDDGDVAPERMGSSWAGGLGQPQFLPRLYLHYAVDFDGDGRRDIWDSVPDTLASIANFLASEGWQRGLPWGFEAKVPADVSCALEGPDRGRSLADWATMGVTKANGEALPVDADHEAFLLMPAGRYGPAFIVTVNFHVIKQYNRSDLYALYIGHLSDRYNNDRSLRGDWATVGGVSRGDVKALQDKLIEQGFDVGGADGLVGYKTRTAIGKWQVLSGLPETCLPDAATIAGLN